MPAVCGSHHTTCLSQGCCMPSSGQTNPHSMITGKNELMASFMASAVVLQMVERKKP